MPIIVGRIYSSLLIMINIVTITSTDQLLTLEETTNLTCIHNLCIEPPTPYPIVEIQKALEISQYKSWPKETMLTNKLYYQDNSNNGDSLCLTKRIHIAPKWGRNIHNIERFIVNIESNTQQFFIEQCRDSKCNELIIKPGYTSVCVQKYIEAVMLVYDTDKILVDKFHILSCCSILTTGYMENNPVTRLFSALFLFNGEHNKSNITNTTKQIYQDCIYDLCTLSPDYYPSKDIKEALNKSNYTNWPISDSNMFVQNRFGISQEGERFCDINTFILKPQLGRNIRDEERLIVNVDSKPQEIVVETCIEKTCNNYDDLPISYTSECVQKFFHIPMLVYHSNEIRIDYIRFPSCCVCYLKHI